MNSNDTNFDCTSDLPDNFDPAWDEPVEQEGCEDWREVHADDYDWSYDAAAWESAYGPADDGGYSF